MITKFLYYLIVMSLPGLLCC